MTRHGQWEYWTPEMQAEEFELERGLTREEKIAFVQRHPNAERSILVRKLGLSRSTVAKYQKELSTPDTRQH